ncbi:hypothetical protein F4803DRAFT_508320 [Xylaria telfairii]|nr:hypothetical protein F4803DRAFT_508320 [Xylaria telfairii]
MDQCASVMLAFPHVYENEAYHKNASAHIQRLLRLLKERAKDLVVYSTSLFDVIDPAIQSLSYLTVLHALIFPSLASNIPQDLILEKLVTFLLKFDGRQCRYAGALLLDIMEAVGNGRLLPPSVAVETLATAILKLDPTGSMLTSSHLLLVRLAYHTSNLEPALCVIDKDIVFYPGMANHENTQHLCDLALTPPSYISKSTGLTALMKNSMVLEYDLVCGLIYCSRREWGNARSAFERVITFPTKDGGCSKIMVEAFKKWILVSLLSEGKHSTTPPHANAFTIKSLEVLGGPYISLATAFATDNVQQLKLEADHNTHVWRDDGNTGLVQEVMAAYQKWRVLSLEEIYTEISIAEIRQQTKSAETGKTLSSDEEVEMLIRNMITAGMLEGTLKKANDGTPFLCFYPPTTFLSEEKFSEEAELAKGKLKELQAIFRATKQRISTSKEYIKWTVKDSKRDKSTEAQDPTLGFEAQIDDEDLMGGLSTI